ncbi:MAG: LytTR family DNA-binding domain-containing protein [Bacteroidota bacterium]
MPKTRCMIVDDEPLAVRVIALHLEQVHDMEVVATCTRALDAYAQLQDTAIDLLFLDIHMPTLSGIDLIKSLEQPPRVIFTTAHRDYALEGFELDVVDYLLKPVALPRLLRALDKYRRLVLPADAHPAHEQPASHHIIIRANRQTVRLDINDIVYIESLSDYVQIFTDSEVIITKERISHLEEKLEKRGFLRIHRSFLVAERKVRAYKTETLTIGDKTLPISRTYRMRVKKVLDALR